VTTAPERPTPTRGTGLDLDDYLADIGDRIRAERQARHWSIRTLSLHSGVPQETLRRLESGSASLRAFAQACMGLGVPMTDLLAEDWQMPEACVVREDQPGMARLSPQQKLVLAEAASGDSLSQVGARLGMDGHQVGAVLSRSYMRLGLSYLDRSERRKAAVRRAVELGLIPEPKRTS
jgi:transcriptional regulator with XRE-family HTH domain